MEKLSELVQVHPWIGTLIGELDEGKQDAVIQHYLSGTPLLDFSKSVYVAAYFATQPDEDGKLPDMGVIYRISPYDVHDNLRIAKVVQAEDLPPQFLRIHRQKGVFLVVSSPALINESPYLLDRWVFYHTEAGVNFNSSQFGIEKSLLLPTEPGR
jgi:hypothetical protein